MSEASISIVQEQEQETFERSKFDVLKQRAWQIVGRAGLAVSIAMGVYGGEAVVDEEYAVAVTDDYPDKDAVACGYSRWCKNGTDISPRLYVWRNCTDWAAWRASQIVGMTIPGGLGDGGSWDDKALARGFEVDTQPEVGDVGVLHIGQYGHVMVVEEVNADGSVDVSEYNWAVDGKFGTRSNVRADKYIDFTPNVNEGAVDSNTPENEDKRSDFNGSGRSDVLLYEPGAGNDHVLYGRATPGDFGPYAIQLDRNYQIAAGNFNGDGEADFFAYGRGNEADYVFYGQPEPGVFNKYAVSINGNYDQIAPGDFDGDGLDDIALYAQNGTDKVMYGTKTGGQFSYADMTLQLNEPYQITSGKYNDDNRSDLFLYNEAGADYVLAGRTTRGSFGKYTTNPQVDRSYERPVSGDFNGDGRDDVLLYGRNGEPDRVFYGRSNAGDFGAYNASVKGDYRPIATGDYNGDGLEDIMMHGPGAGPDKVLSGSKTEGSFNVTTIELNGNYSRIDT